MTNTFKQLAQSRPSNTSNTSIYSPDINTETIIKSIIICNTSGAIANLRVFVDDDGTTYNEATAIVWDMPIYPSTQPSIIEVNICMNNSNGNLAIRTDTASALTVTVFGMEQT